jgi:hypothetical protein
MDKHQRHDPDLTLGSRAVAALVSVLFVLPVAGLVWLSMNRYMVVISESLIPVSYLVFSVLAFAAFSFVFPKLSSTVFGKLVESLLAFGRNW